MIVSIIPAVVWFVGFMAYWKAVFSPSREASKRWIYVTVSCYMVMFLFTLLFVEIMQEVAR